MTELLSKVLAKVVGKQTEIQKQTVSAYAGIVAKIADGKEPDAEQVLTVLRDTGKTADTLAADVELLVKRRGWAKQLAEQATHEATMARIDAEVTRLEAAHGVIVDKHNEAVWALKHQKSKAAEAVNAAMDAQRQLMESCPADIRDEINAGRLEQNAAVERKKRAKDTMERAKNDHYSLAKMQSEGRPLETGALESAAAWVERSKSAVSEIEREIEERQQRLDEVTRRMLLA